MSIDKNLEVNIVVSRKNLNCIIFDKKKWQETEWTKILKTDSLKKNDVAKSKDDLISQRLQELDEKADKITAELKAWFEQGKQEFYKLELPCFKSIEDDFSLCLKEILPFVRFDYYGDNGHGAHSESVSFCICFRILRVHTLLTHC